MSSSFGNPNEIAREIDGQFRPGIDRIVEPPKFGAVCKLLWPNKTDAYIAAIAKVDPRTARRWISGEYDPPVIVIVTMLQEMFRKE